MAAADNIRRNFNAFFDGYSQAGKVEEFTPPSLMTTGEDFRAGGMDAPIELKMGMEKMEATIKMASVDVETLRLWGRLDTVPLIVRGALESRDGTVKAEVFRVRGRVKGLEQDAIQPGVKSGVTYTVAVHEFTYTVNGVEVHNIDIPNMKCIVNGTDVLAEQRRALGLA